MSDTRVNIPLAKGPLAIVIIGALLVIRFMTIGEVNDPELDTAIRAELLNDVGASVSQALEDLDPADGNAIDELVQLSDAENITLHSVKVSKPLLAFGSSTDAIVRVEFTLPGRTRRTEYWRFTHSTAAGWRYRRPASVFSYYLNFF